jgi:hypothetical protein
VKTAHYQTDVVGRYTVRRLEELAEQRLCGFVLKKDSPTCGLEPVRVYNASGVPNRDGRGLFAAALVERFPTLPVEEEGRAKRSAASREFHRMHLRLSGIWCASSPADGRYAILCVFTPRES